MKTPCKRCGGSGAEPDLEKMGSKVRAAREKRGWSMRYLGGVVGCTAPYICDIEHGRRPLTGDKAREILRVLEVKP